MPNLDSIVPSSMAAVTAGKTLYGLPTSNYTQGLIYNRKLFSEAGLNPNDPPTTWAEVETDATAIAKLGNGIEGWGDYSAGNNGGWHFSSYMDALGGSMVNTTTAPPTANFDNADGLAILEALHTLRFTDNAMSPTQGLAWGTLQQQFAAGKLGMYIAAPDDIYNVIVPSDKGNLSDIGMGPLPSLTGTPAGSLSGGNDYVFAKKDTPAQIEAGIKWIDFEDLTPGDGQFNFARQKADGFPVGFAEPDLFNGAVEAQINQLRDASATINTSYYTVVRQRERARRRRAARRPGGLQVARPDHAGGADREERQHPGAAQAGSDQRQRRTAVRRGITAETTGPFASHRFSNHQAPGAGGDLRRPPRVRSPVEPHQEQETSHGGCRDGAQAARPAPAAATAARQPPRAEGAAKRRGVGIPDRRGALLQLLLLVPDRPRNHHELPEADLRGRLHLGGPA